MAKGREKSDGCVVPQGRRKPAPTAARRGGKAATVSQQASQLELFVETAESPQGDVGRVDTGLPVPGLHAVPKSKNTGRRDLSAMMMTMSEVASTENLRRAFARVAANKGAPGPDRQTIEEVRVHLDRVLPKVREELLDGSYRPGMIRRGLDSQIRRTPRPRHS